MSSPYAPIHPTPPFGLPRRRLLQSLATGSLAVAAVLALTVLGMRTLMADSDPAKPPVTIDGKRAFGYLESIVAIGPRPAGSEANTKQRNMVAKHFEAHGGSVREQPFSGTDPISGKPVAMVNLIGSWFPERTDRVLLAAHYDTRPFPDEDPDPAKRKLPFLGANDGASGVALLMELAHHVGGLKTPWGVDLVLFDGEELVYGDHNHLNGEYFLGSKVFAKAYASSQRARPAGKTMPKYAAALVLDMVGDKDLTVDKEPHSLDFNPRLVRDVWAVAKALGVTQFRDQIGQVAVQDDHLPLYNGGIPAIDIIDFDYPHWHTAADVPANCSGASLEVVGKVVVTWLAKPKPRR